MPCPRCRQLIGVNSERCMHCGLSNPAFFANFPILGSLLRSRIQFTNGIVIACVGLYIAALALDISRLMASGSAAGLLLQPSNQALFNLGMGGALAWADGRWWTLLTSNYLHGSILHIFFNLWVLRSYGPLAEELFGSSRFIIIYTIAGITGALVSTMMGTIAFVGASGAIFGLGGALIYYGWRRGGTFGRGLLRNMIIWAGINFVIGLSMAYIDNWGHLGGLVGGFLAALLLGYEERRRQDLWHHILALLTLAFIMVCFVLMVTTYVSSAL
jgi:rhomboid protease GluP